MSPQVKTGHSELAAFPGYLSSRSRWWALPLLVVLVPGPVYMQGRFVLALGCVGLAAAPPPGDDDVRHLLRLSEGRGSSRSPHQCIEPPPPLERALLGSASRRNAAAAPSHVKYLGLDGSTDLNESSWTNLGFWSGANTTELQTQLDAGFSVLASMHGQVVTNCIWHVNSDLVHAISSAPRAKYPRREELQQQRRGEGTSRAHDGKCVERMKAWWTGPNASAPGYWNTTMEPLVKQKKLLGVYFGDELLGGGVPVSNLTALFDMVKAVWPDGINYYNEEWTPLNDPDWKDSTNASYGVVPASLDWISYDFYRLNNVSWLQPMCEYHQNLYSKMNTGTNKQQRAVLLPGGWGSTSGPRGGAGQFAKHCAWCPGPNCTVDISMSCTSDPMSCTNLDRVLPTGTGNGTLNGLEWEVEDVLVKLGNDGARPAECWPLAAYDDFNVMNAWAYYDWAASDPMVVGIVIWPWSGFMSCSGYPGVNVGLQQLENATAAWTAIGKKIKAGQAAATTAEEE